MSPRSLPQEPRTPQIFFGRDAELAHIIDTILTNIGSHPARIAILGPGGYGKTTLANAVLTHDRVQEHFGDAKHFIACESVFSSGALLLELGKTLGVLKGAPDALWSRIRAFLDATECILCLDNFESPWDQAEDSKQSVKEFLSRITELRHVTLLITIRGAERPGQTQWTRPLFPPLQTLSYDAARATWEHIADVFDDSAEELIKAVDYVPLAVSILAHLSQVTPPALLWKEWNVKQTGAVRRGQAHRLSNLEFSIQLSIDSKRMRCSPASKDLLGVLSLLPDGIHITQLETFSTILHDVELISCLQILQQCGLIKLNEERYQPHPIIRHFSNSHSLASPNMKASLEEYYITLASISWVKVEPNKYAEIMLNVNNTKAMLGNLIKSDYKDQKKLISAICAFLKFQQTIGDFSDGLISQAIQHIQENNNDTSLLIMCFQQWGGLFYYASNYDKAKSKAKEAERLCLLDKDKYYKDYAWTLYCLGDVYHIQEEYVKAKESYEKAIRLLEEKNDTFNLGPIYSSLADILLSSNNFDEAEAINQKALDLAKKKDNIINQGNIYRGLGNIYLLKNQLDKAEASYQKALEHYKAAYSFLGMGNIFDDLGELYMQQSKLPKAKNMFEEAIKMFRKAQNQIWVKECQNKLDKVLHMIK